MKLQFICAFFLMSVVATGQVDTVLLKMHSVEANKGFDDLSKNTSIIKNESIKALKPIGWMQLINSMSTSFLRPSGPNGSSALSIRGFNPSHTKTYYEGIQISSLQNGQFDFSLLPITEEENIELNSGANSLISGNGGLGGSLQIYNEQKHTSGITVFSEVGNYSHKHKGLSIVNKGNKVTNHFTTGRLANDLNYDYYKRGTHYKIYNAGFSQNYFTNSTIFDISKHSRLKLTLLVTETQRDIPNSTLFRNEIIDLDKTQYDLLFLGGLTFETQFKKGVLFVNHSVQQLHNVYNDVLLNNVGDNKYIQPQQQIRYRHYINENFKLQIGALSSFQQAKSLNYPAKKNRFQSEPYIGFNFKSNNTKLGSFILAKTLLLDKSKPKQNLSAGVNYQLFKFFGAGINASHQYQVPTFNDLYWSPGGNKDLLVEEANMIEVKTTIKKDMSKLNCFASVTGYLANVKNQIDWEPINPNIWEARNLQEVDNKGVEVSGTIVYKYAKYIAFRINVRHIYMRSTLATNPEKLRRDFLPRSKTGTLLSFQFKKNLSISYNRQYVGLVFTNSSNTQFILPYLIHNAQLNYVFDRLNRTIAISVIANNILNEVYFTTPKIPMSPRLFRIKLKLNINKKNEK